jgi:hypothetical protein
MRPASILALLFLILLSCAPAKSATLSVPYRLDEQGLVKIPCSTETGKTYACEIDTGAAQTVGETYTAIVPIGSDRVDINTVSGSSSAAIVLTYLTISGKRFRISMVVSQGPRKLGFDVLIGQDVLSQFRSVQIDYANHVVIFETRN